MQMTKLSEHWRKEAVDHILSHREGHGVLLQKCADALDVRRAEIVAQLRVYINLSGEEAARIVEELL